MDGFRKILHRGHPGPVERCMLLQVMKAHPWITATYHDARHAVRP